MTARSAHVDVWKWAVAAGLAALVVLAVFRVAFEGLSVARAYVDQYAAAHRISTQETMTEWTGADGRQTLRTARESAEELTTWIQRHRDAVLGFEQAGQAPSGREGR